MPGFFCYLNRFKLDTVAKALNISLQNHHRAVDDAGATAEIFAAFVKMLRDRDVNDLNQLNALSTMDTDTIRKLPTHHVIILAKNDIGRVNMYRLVSWSHLEYYARRPRIPKSLLEKYREGLIIGSACEAGELYQALPSRGAGYGDCQACEFLRLPGNPASGKQRFYAPGREEYG